MTDTELPKVLSFSLGGAKTKPAPANNSLKRPHASVWDDEDDGDGTHKVQRVSHFDLKAGGAIDENRPKARGPLVIQLQSDGDWRQSRQRRQRSALPAPQRTSATTGPEDTSSQRTATPQFGFNIASQSSQAEVEIEEAQSTTQVNAEQVLKTDDELALDALLGHEQQSTLVVPALAEEDAYERDVRAAPDVPTLEDYTRIPVDEFGAAMLRGMGWNGKLDDKSKTKAPDRRPALLGIGAKKDAAIDAELGGWGKAARGKEIKIYNPVLLKDKRTGQTLTEAELQQKQEQDQRRKYEEEFEEKERRREKKHRRDADDEHRESGRKDRERYQDDRSRDDRERRRHRSRDRYDSRRDDRDSRRRHDYDRPRDDSRKHRSERDQSRDRHKDRRDYR